MLSLKRFFTKQQFIRNYASGKKLLKIAEDQNTGTLIIIIVFKLDIYVFAKRIYLLKHIY